MSTRRDMYHVDLLPRSSPIPAEALAKFKALRLEALRTSPSTLGSPSRNAMEAAFSDASWEQQINKPLSHYLICHIYEHTSNHVSAGGDGVEDDQATSSNWLLDKTWVGMLNLVGSISRDKYSVPVLLGPDEEETRWLLEGVYVQQSHRCEESIIAIHGAILGYLRMWTEKELHTVFDPITGVERSKRARLAGFPYPVLQKMYQAFDAQEVGKASLGRLLAMAGIEEANADGHAEDDGEAITVMERVIEC